MKIDRIEWWEVDQFVHQEMVNSPEYAQVHEQWDLVPKCIIRLHTDDGHYGVGESPRGTALNELESACRGLLGLDPLSLNLRRIPLQSGGNVYRCIETAVFDLVGRVRSMRVGELLGGYCRDQVVSSYWAGLQSPEYAPAAAAGARDGGYSCLKIKVMHGMDVVDRLQRMLDVAPELRFIVDAMQRYDSYEEMCMLAQRCAELNVLCIEDPLPKNQLDSYKTLREETGVKIALHLGSTRAIIEALEADAADIFNCSPSSMVEFVRMADVAATADKPCWHGSGVDLGILDLAYIHATAVADAATVPHDILSTPLHVDDFVVDMPKRSGERIAVPTEPGLGGELDMDAVQRYVRTQGEWRI
jgi:muconate cycloisomerase